MTPRIATLSALFAVLLVAAAIALGFLLGRRERPGLFATEIHEEVADTRTVVTAVRELARLETVAYHMERVIDLKHRSPHLFGMIHADAAILLVAAGDVIAGVDLAKMQDGDITLINEPPAKTRVRIRLPPAEILSARLDNQRTYVHSRNTDLLARGGDEIETRARQLAESSIRDAAIEAGILNRAQQGTERAMIALLRGLGFDHVEFETAPASASAK